MIEPVESEHALTLLRYLLGGREPRTWLPVHLADDQQGERRQLPDQTIRLNWLQQPSKSLTRNVSVNPLGPGGPEAGYDLPLYMGLEAVKSCPPGPSGFNCWLDGPRTIGTDLWKLVRLPTPPSEIALDGK
jgi:hypothetical protein